MNCVHIHNVGGGGGGGGGGEAWGERGLDRSGRVLVSPERLHRPTSVLIMFKTVPLCHNFFYSQDNPSKIAFKS